MVLALGPRGRGPLWPIGARAGDGPVIPPDALPAMVEAAATGLARRGRCAVGDKTILDALRPAADGLAATGSWSVAVAAAARGARATRPLIARRGLAMRLGERSAGHLDPGAVSCTLLLRALGGG